MLIIITILLIVGYFMHACAVADEWMKDFEQYKKNNPQIK